MDKTEIFVTKDQPTHSHGDAWKQRSRTKNYYNRSFYNFTMRPDMNRQAGETLCPYRSDLSNDANARRAALRHADIRYAYRLSFTLILVHFVLFARKMRKKNASIRAIQ